MRIGTYYYPEQWPREQWKRDFDNIAAMGLQIVHMGEFAWFEMEAWPGEIRLDWLEECVEMARQRKLQVILCTPTASPPIWLVQQNPEVLPLDDSGRRTRFGGRRHYSPTSPAMHEATRRIVSALADRFKDNPAVIGWQIDNEFSSSGFFDQNQHSYVAFRQWLSAKHGTIAALNKAWGNQVWNTYYQNFSEILLPPRRESWGNPHHILDACRFQSWTYAQFHKLQADILRESFKRSKRKEAEPFITTNFMSLHPDINPADFAADCSMMTWDQYAVGGFEPAPTGQDFRMGDPGMIGLMHDLMASFSGRWGLMELQPGQVNWGAAPVLLYPGAVRLWLWTAFAHGAEFVTTYRYRQPRFGSEMWHHGLVGTDGVTPSPGGRQFEQVIDEIKRLTATAPSAVGAATGGPAAATASIAASATPSGSATAGEGTGRTAMPTIGLFFDFDQLWWQSILPQSRCWSYQKFVRLWYGAVARLGCRVRILQPNQEIPAGLSMLIVPAMQMIDDGFVTRLEQYASNGGHLLLTCRTALQDRTGQFFEGPIAQPILQLIGGAVEAYDGLPDGTTGQVEMDGHVYPWGVWGALLYAEPDTRVLARYADQFYVGANAVIQRKLNKGLVTYCGVFAEQAFHDALLEKLMYPAPPAPADDEKRRSRRKQPATSPPVPAVHALPSRVHVLRRDRHRVLLNYSGEVVQAPAPANARFIVGDRTVEPADVAVWEE